MHNEFLGCAEKSKRDLHRDFCFKNYRGERWKRERKQVRKVPIHNCSVAVGFIHFHGFGVCPARKI